MRLWFLFIPILSFGVCPFQQFHKSTYKAGWDIDFSPYAGGENILFIHRAIERGEGYFIGRSPAAYSTSASARFFRFCELYMGWLPVNYLAVVAQHEVFGHGYRLRDIGRGTKVEGYSFNTPPPYGPGGAATSYNLGPSFTTTDESAVALGGVESTAILAQLTKFKWLESRFIDPRQTVLYLLSQHDLNLYIGTLDTDEEDLDGHDIHSYIQSLNYTYTEGAISSSQLRALSWINLADPFTYFSIYAWFRYFLSGKETHIPMIPLFNMGYLPTIRLGLAPYGPEFYFENYLLNGKRPLYFYLKGGSHSDNGYGGCGFYAPSIFAIKKWFIGCRFDAWREPKLLLEPGAIPFDEIDFDADPNPSAPLYPYSEQHAMRFGGAASLIIAYHNRSGFEVELGYKSKGFLPGYSLRSSPTARLYYSLIF